MKCEVELPFQVCNKCNEFSAEVVQEDLMACGQIVARDLKVVCERASLCLYLMREQQASGGKCKYCGRDLGAGWAWCAWCGRTVIPDGQGSGAEFD